MEDFEGADWVLISDDVPVDEAHRDELLESFQATHRSAGRRRVVAADEDEELELDEEEEALDELDDEP
jgi:hypothetical protein